MGEWPRRGQRLRARSPFAGVHPPALPPRPEGPGPRCPCRSDPAHRPWTAGVEKRQRVGVEAMAPYSVEMPDGAWRSLGTVPPEVVARVRERLEEVARELGRGVRHGHGALALPVGDYSALVVLHHGLRQLTLHEVVRPPAAPLAR
jgi:hypothetical protein